MRFFFPFKISLSVLKRSCLYPKKKLFNLREGLSFKDTEMLQKFKQNTEKTSSWGFLLISFFNEFEVKIMCKILVVCMEHTCEDST